MSSYSNPLTEYSPQMEFAPEATEYAGAESRPKIFDEAEEIEMAASLLEVRDEAELENYLAGLVNAASQATQNPIPGPGAHTLVHMLKKALGRVAPNRNRWRGFGGPFGQQIGRSLSSVAGQALGLELEGLSPEDREFEAARQFVRFAGDAVKNARDLSDGAIDAVHEATREAARKYAPGLAQVDGVPSHLNAGQWVRRRGRIILYGV